jgi:predicted HTH transcriptional regulator
MAPVFTSPVEKSINQQLQALEREKRALEKARQALKGGGASRAKPSQKRTRKTSKPTRADQALDWIEKHPGVTAAEISEAIGVSKPHAYQLVSKLMAEEAVVRHQGKYQSPSSAVTAASGE